jgi:hypothetical protein
LGHPSSTIVDRIVKDNSLFSNESSLVVGDAYQQAKSHKLPYPSNSISSYPLELIFLDVWVLEPNLLVITKILLSY